MPLHRYGVLKGTVTDRKAEGGDKPQHYQVEVQGGDTQFRIAVNVRSQLSPPDLLFVIVDDFRHPITAGLGSLAPGFTAIPSQPGGQALDFIRGNLFDRTRMRPLPGNAEGENNDLNEVFNHYIGRAMADADATIYAFGERWGPEHDTRDKVFSFLPGNGIHDIHMNQGNVGRFTRDDGVWQDGGLLLHFGAEERWVGVFLAFSSQSWHTDDQTGHTILAPDDRGPADNPNPAEPDFQVQIVAALVNPVGPAPERETVTLLNRSPATVDLTGWALADRMKRKQVLSGTVAPGAAAVVALAGDVQLGNNGGIITLLNRDGLKVHGVSYTAEQARREGWSIVF